MLIKKRLKYCFLLLFVMFTNNLFAQLDIAWNKKYVSNDNEMGISVLETLDNGFAILGGSYTYSNSKIPKDIILLKTDTSGNEIWKKNYNSGNNDMGNTVLQTNDGGFIIFGSALEEFAWLIKVDSEGDTLWTKKYNGVNGYSMMQIDSGYALLGFSNNTDSLLWISNVDNYGNVSSSNFIGTQFYSYDSLNLTFDKTLYSISGYKIMVSSKFGGLQVIQTDQEGNLIWITPMLTSVYGNSFYSGVVTVECEENNCVTHADSGMVMVGKINRKLGVIKTFYNDEVHWIQDYELFNKDAIGKSIVRTLDKGYIITGVQDDFDKQVFLLKIDVSGNLIWKKELGSGEGNKVYLTNDQGIVICGESNKGIFLTKLSVLPIALINADSNLFDEDWDGYLEVVLDGSLSTNINGYNIEGYEWNYNGEVVGTNPVLEIQLMTGDNIIELKVTDENGISNTTQKIVKVCSYKLETEGAITSSISTIGDSIFFASSFDDKVYCFNDKNNLKWNLSIGGEVQSTTTIGPNKNIYVGSGDTRLYCFDPNGNFKWDTPMGGIVSASPAITQERTVYVGTENNRLYSVNGDDGSINWNYLTGGPITSSASLSENGNIYFGSNDKKFYSLNSSGNLNWSYTTNGEIHSTPAIDTTGRIYIGSNDANLYSLNSDGTLSWSFSTSGSVKSSPVIDSQGNVYFGSEDGFFYSVNVEGNENWKYDTDSPVNGNPSLTTGGNVIFGCDDGNIYSLSVDGEYNWNYKTENKVVAAPLINSDGKIYVGSHDNLIYGFMDPDHKLDKRNSLLHQWPTFQKDNKRTGSQTEIMTGLKNISVNGIPSKFSLLQNYPNPFNPSTKIEFHLAEASFVELTIYSVTGEKIKSLLHSDQKAGYYSVDWNGLNENSEKVGSGFYIYQIKVNSKTASFTKSRKMVIMK